MNLLPAFLHFLCGLIAGCIATVLYLSAPVLAVAFERAEEIEREAKAQAATFLAAAYAKAEAIVLEAKASAVELLGGATELRRAIDAARGQK